MDHVDNEHLKAHITWMDETNSDGAYKLVECLSGIDYLSMGVVHMTPGNMKFIVSYNPQSITQAQLEELIRSSFPTDQSFITFAGYHTTTSSS